jgi:hypothetical protein
MASRPYWTITCTPSAGRWVSRNDRRGSCATDPARVRLPPRNFRFTTVGWIACSPRLFTALANRATMESRSIPWGIRNHQTFRFHLAHPGFSRRSPTFIGYPFEDTLSSVAVKKKPGVMERGLERGQSVKRVKKGSSRRLTQLDRRGKAAREYALPIRGEDVSEPSPEAKCTRSVRGLVASSVAYALKCCFRRNY